MRILVKGPFMNITDQLKPVIYWVGLGASLVVYAHGNFTTKEEVSKLEEKVEKQATKEDVARLEGKIDALNNYLLNKK